MGKKGVQWKSGAPDWARKLRDARRLVTADMRAAVLAVESETFALIKLGVNMGIYYTEPGRFYERTEDLFDGIEVLNNVQLNAFSIIIRNRIPYSGDVEVGKGKHQEPLILLQLQAERLGSKFTPLYLGRTGRKYEVPNPAHLRGMTFAFERLKEEFRKSIQKRLVFGRR